MIHIIKNNKWVITIFLVTLSIGLLTFFTFINQSFIKLNDFNLQALLVVDAILLVTFFGVIIRESYKILKKRKKGSVGSETSTKYIFFFSATTLLPAILISIFSLLLFNVGFQKYFDKKIKTVVNNSSEVTRNYIEETRKSLEADILLIAYDINSKFGIFYDNPKLFLNLLASQRMLRRLDELYLLDSSGNIIMSNIVDSQFKFSPPPEEAYTISLSGKPVRINDETSKKTSSLIKLNNFIDTYLYIVKFMDPQVIKYLSETDKAISFYYSVQNQKTGIKITFAITYVLFVSLLLFVSLIIAINVATRFTKPIINLIDASEKISGGNLNVKVPLIETDDEIKKLNETFNSMLDKLKKQQDKLLFTERHAAWENVARKLAHEIKNPLTPIQLSIDRIKEKYLNKITDDSENFSNYLSTINKQIKDIEHLINEFSDFARMPKPVLKKINLNQIISRAVSLNELSEPNIKFTISKTKDTNFAKGDEEQLNRVFINLIKNSIESIQEKRNKNVDFKGKIQVDINSYSDYIYVSVKDNGIGFGQINKKEMVTPYFTTKKKGTGLGLSVVEKIISDHNSTILFNSTSEGAKVEISIPI